MRESTEKLLEQLKKYPLFDLIKVARKLRTSKEYIRLFIHRLKKKKVVFSIEKNKYTLCKDHLVVASNLVWPSYITGWTALRYHNLTEQLPNTIEIITSKKRKKRELSFQEMNIKFITTKPGLMFGFVKCIREEKEFFIAEPEKALIDAALYKIISLSEIEDIIVSNFPRLQKSKLISYLLRIANKSLIKRFGYILDKAGKDYYARLQKHIDHNYILLDYSLPVRGKKNIKWRIINNVTKR
ncbi:hypothetical protein J4207_03515 [Candidatus Woesearchaeota archaeon]|nr:hypothetical protein [Candidatus Woesearchaeota archaeon]